MVGFSLIETPPPRLKGLVMERTTLGVVGGTAKELRVWL